MKFRAKFKASTPVQDFLAEVRFGQKRTVETVHLSKLHEAHQAVHRVHKIAGVSGEA
jgi:hypothetical protein